MEQASASLSNLGEPFSLSLVGYGSWGQRLSRRLCKDRILKLTSIVSRSKALEQRELVNGVIRTPCIDTVLKDPKVEALWIATPPNACVSLAREALVSGKHVLIEKPVREENDVKSLFSLARQVNRALVIGYTSRFDPCIRATQASPIRVDEYSNHWDKWGSFGMDIVSSLVCHDLAITVRLFGSTPKEMEPLAEPGEDFYHFRWIWESGVAIIRIDRRATQKRRVVRINSMNRRIICGGHPMGSDAISKQIQFFGLCISNPSMSWSEEYYEISTARGIRSLLQSSIASQATL